MKPYTEKLRNKYIQNPPEGMTAEDIRSMSDEDLLDMDYFLNEDEFDDDEIGEEGFYIFLTKCRLFRVPASVQAFFKWGCSIMSNFL